MLSTSTLLGPRSASSGAPGLDGGRVAAERVRQFQPPEDASAVGPLSGRELPAPQWALARQHPHRCAGAVWPSDHLGNPELAKPRPQLASGSQYHDALEPLLRGGGVGDGPWPGHSPALADAGASQCQRHRCGLDRLAGEGGPAPERVHSDQDPGGSRFLLR